MNTELTASEFLTYGGVLKVVRTDGSNLNNANAGVGIGSTTAAKIKSFDDYNLNYSSATNYYYAARNPGSWGNGLKVCVIDNAADQVIGITTTSLADAGAIVGNGVTSVLSSVVLPGAGTTTTFNGYLKGIITGVSTATSGASTINVRVLSRVSTDGTETAVDYQENNPGQSFEAALTTSSLSTMLVLSQLRVLLLLQLVLLLLLLLIGMMLKHWD